MSHSLKPSHYGSTHKYWHQATTISVEERMLKIMFPQQCKTYSSIDFIINMQFFNLFQTNAEGGQYSSKYGSDDTILQADQNWRPLQVSVQ